jgi:urease accessory protein
MERADSPPTHRPAVTPGLARLAFHRAGPAGKTALGTAYATSPLRILTPKNHGDAAWLFLSSFGGGLVDGDHLDVEVEVARGASAFLGTQASTKVYRSPHGCSQRLRARVDGEAALAVVPDPVVCFAGARYEQHIDIALDPTASLVLLDGYTSGRSARGERWAFSRYASRTTLSRGGVPAVIDATLLDPRHGPLAERMGRFDVVLSLLALGPRFAPVRAAMLGCGASRSPDDALIASASPLGEEGCLVRVAAQRFEAASRSLRPSFAALAQVLGDDPFARKW